MTQTHHPPLAGQVAIVTGGARGIGRSAALRLAREGADIVLADLMIDRAEGVAEEIRATGRRAVAIEVDTANRASVDAMVSSVEAEFKRVDILVNNAAIARSASFLEQTKDHWESHIAINLTGVFNCSQAVAKLMVKAGYGRIVSIASIAGMIGPLDFSAYGAAKAGVIGLTRAMSLELSDYGITANAIAPGPVDTELLREAWSPDAYAKRAQHVPVARLAHVDEIVHAILMLAVPDAGYISGIVLPVDGGAVAAGAYMSEKYRRRTDPI